MSNSGKSWFAMPLSFYFWIADLNSAQSHGASDLEYGSFFLPQMPDRGNR